MDDDTAMDVTVIENLQRVDLSLMEEARGVKSLLGTGRTVAMVAGEIGKGIQWVVRRAKLADLAPELVNEIETNPESPLTRTSIAHLELIARFSRSDRSTKS